MQIRGVESRVVERGQIAVAAAVTVLSTRPECRVSCVHQQINSFLDIQLSGHCRRTRNKSTREISFQIGIRRLASRSRCPAAACSVPGRGFGHEGSARVRVDVRDATIGERPELHGSSRAAARQGTASRLDPHRRTVQPSLSGSRRAIRRDGEYRARSFARELCRLSHAVYRSGLTDLRNTVFRLVAFHQ